MKAKHIVLAAALLATIGLFTSCKNEPKGPEAVAKQAMTALQNGDYDGFVNTFNMSDSDKQMLVGLLKEKGTESIDEHGGIRNFKITDKEIDGDHAKVVVHIVYKDGVEGDEELKFVQEDGAWYQEFNK